jgi:hypothetical protein
MDNQEFVPAPSAEDNISAAREMTSSAHLVAGLLGAASVTIAAGVTLQELVGESDPRMRVAAAVLMGAAVVPAAVGRLWSRG